MARLLNAIVRSAKAGAGELWRAVGPLRALAGAPSPVNGFAALRLVVALPSAPDTPAHWSRARPQTDHLRLGPP